MDAEENLGDHVPIEIIQQLLDFLIPRDIGIEPEIRFVFLQQPDEIRLEQHPGLGHVPVELLGRAVDRLVAVAAVAGV